MGVALKREIDSTTILLQGRAHQRFTELRGSNLHEKQRSGFTLKIAAGQSSSSVWGGGGGGCEEGG